MFSFLLIYIYFSAPSLPPHFYPLPWFYRCVTDCCSTWILSQSKRVTISKLELVNYYLIVVAFFRENLSSGQQFLEWKSVSIGNSWKYSFSSTWLQRPSIQWLLNNFNYSRRLITRFSPLNFLVMLKAVRTLRILKIIPLHQGKKWIGFISFSVIFLCTCGSIWNVLLLLRKYVSLNIISTLKTILSHLNLKSACQPGKGGKAIQIIVVYMVGLSILVMQNKNCDYIFDYLYIL